MQKNACELQMFAREGKPNQATESLAEMTLNHVCESLHEICDSKSYPGRFDLLIS
jgi:hypothetical protein